MSGVVGWVDFRRDLRTEEAVLHAMTETMAARGPDARGLWVSEHAALGHRQLVVDRTSARQPLVLDEPSGSIVVALDGRIANAVELTKELGSFDDSSQVETLARAFLRWGDAFIERLDGAFAFTLWDARARRLLLGRDRLGVRPLYYAEHDGGLLFASEPKGILANPLFRRRLALEAVPILLQPRLALAGETPLVGLKEVSPAHVVAYSALGLRPRRYWQLESAPHTDSFPDTARTVRALLEASVSRELAAAVPLGAMLSGGVDSTSIVALALAARRVADPQNTLDTFCIQFESDSSHFVPSELRPDIDAPYAAKAAQALGSRHHPLVVSAAELDEVVAATRAARDLPGWGQFDASMYVLFREMREHCTVAFTGEAADEIFGGYPYCYDAELLQRQQFPWLGSAPRLSDYLSVEVTRQLDPRADERDRYARLLSDVPRLPGEDPEQARMREVLYLGMSGPLAVILDRKDRMSACLGLEVRVPFCDHRLVQYVWNVPWSMKSRGGVKGLLKAAMADVLPTSTLERKKSAYPHVQSPEHDRALVDEVRRLAANPSSALSRLFEVQRLSGLIAELGEASRRDRRAFPGGASPAYLLIHLLELERWLVDYRVSLD